VHNVLGVKKSRQTVRRRVGRDKISLTLPTIIRSVAVNLWQTWCFKYHANFDGKNYRLYFNLLSVLPIFTQLGAVHKRRPHKIAKNWPPPQNVAKN